MRLAVDFIHDNADHYLTQFGHDLYRKAISTVKVVTD